MSDKIGRQKVVERDDFTYEEKEAIAAKSDHRCAHCGKKVYFGYGASVEHFIPLSKGGSNRDINLVMLCLDCNQEKGNLILYPKDYLKYLNEEHLEKLEGYFESYAKSFEFVSRRNLLACDQYKVFIDPIYQYSRNRKNPRFSIRQANNSVLLKRAEVEDIPKIKEYFEKYAKKYNCFENSETIDLNIRFWMQFGCIYYIEGTDGIKVMAAVTVTNMTGFEPLDDIGYTLSMSLFAYYDTDYSLTLCNGLLRSLPRFIMTEQGLTQVPVRVTMMEHDKVTAAVLTGSVYKESTSNGLFVHQYIMMHLGGPEETRNPQEDGALKAFFEKFSDVEEEARNWLGNRGDVMSWMISDITLEEECGKK